MTHPYRSGEHIINAIPPALPAAAMQTYSIRQKLRKATCEDVNCHQYRDGFMVLADENDVEPGGGAQRAAWIRNNRRGFREQMGCDIPGFEISSTITVFVFPPGNRCFAEHKSSYDDETMQSFARRGGDFRGNPRGDLLRMPNAQAWVDDFGEHQEVLADRLKEG